MRDKTAIVATQIGSTAQDTFVALELQKISDYIQKNRPIFPERYYRAQRTVLLRDVAVLFEKNPAMLPKTVLETILHKLPDWLPAANLVQVSSMILKEWEKLQMKKSLGH